jgi:hypothetical protein
MRLDNDGKRSAQTCGREARRAETQARFTTDHTRTRTNARPDKLEAETMHEDF